jgi:uncharacterized FlgJ-related protein
MYRSTRARLLVGCTALVIALGLSTASAQEVIVMSSPDELVAWLQAEEWWGEEKRGEQLQVPHVMITGISQRWAENAQKMTVQQKKEIFYRLLLPLVVHANDIVLDRRSKLEQAKDTLESGNSLPADDTAELRRAAVLLRILDEDDAAELGGSQESLIDVIDETLYRLDVIPAGLVLGQAAYESGYGTSRFAAEGNALFGQWTYGGKGLVPEQQRKQLGDHRIASFEWPFDSVRGYYLNLSSHPAYEDFRRLRAELKAAGEPLTSMALADGLIRYSERGQEYVDTLKGIIRVNGLSIADGAVFRDEPTRFLVGAKDAAAAEEVRQEIEAMRESGELAQIVARMRLE